MPLPAKMPVDGADSASEPVAITRKGLHLSSREVPPGGLSYKILALAERAPQIAWVGPHNDSDTLTKEVNVRERANGITPSTLAEVEEQICQRLPPGYCRDAGGKPTSHPGSFALSLADVLAGTKALAGWFRHGSVDNAEIARRTAICNACPENRQISGCQGCAGAPLHALMNAIVVRSLPSDAMLGACAICKCSLKAKVRMKLDDLPALTPEQRARLPEACWLIAPASQRDSDPRV